MARNGNYHYKLLLFRPQQRTDPYFRTGDFIYSTLTVVLAIQRGKSYKRKKSGY